MRSFTEQLKQYEPEVLFSIKKYDVSVQFDKNEPLWSTDDSVVFNEYSGDYFKAKMVRGNNKNDEHDPNFIGNQLTENEIYNENDYSLHIGRNGTHYNGYNYSFYRDEPFDEEYELQKELTAYFQLNVSTNDMIKRTRVINYDTNDDYAVVFIDSNSPDYTQVFRASYSYDELTNKETWGNAVSPILYRAYYDGYVSMGERASTVLLTKDVQPIKMEVIDGQEVDSQVTPADEFGGDIISKIGEHVRGEISLLNVGTSDKRLIYIALINPRTGEHYDSYRLMFDRKSKLVEGENYTLSDKDKAHDIYKLFEQKPYTGTTYTDETKPTIDKIIIGTSGNKDMILKKWVKGQQNEITVPVLNDVRVVVNNKTVTNRDFLIETGMTNTDEYKFMQFMYFDFNYDHNNRRIRVYNKANNNVNIYNIGLPLDTSVIFAVSMKYEYLDGHDPENNYFNYNMIFKFKINNVEYSAQKVNYKGSRYTFKDRGTGVERNTVPTFLNLPIMLGWLPKQSRDTRYGYKKYNFNIGDHITQCEYIQHFNYTIPTNIINIDNFSLFDGDYAYNQYYNLYYKSFSNSNRILDQNLINYWACDELVGDLLTVKNRFVYTNSSYTSFDIYSDMRIKPQVYKNGYVKHEKHNHRAIKDSIYFNNATGNANIRNRTWSQNGNYTISFWFKSEQKTNGVILADYENKYYGSKGVYFGLTDGGYLELRINDFNARTYNNYSITDGEWHLIILRVTAGATENVNNYMLYVDDQIMDRFNGNIGSKDYNDSYQVYFMGHPRGNNVIGNLAKVSFYNVSLSDILVHLMYEGDIEHNVKGTILMENMPLKTEVRVYKNRTGELVSRVESDNDSGIFIYRNFNNFDVYIVVIDKTKMFGEIQTIGPIEPKSIE